VALSLRAPRSPPPQFPALAPPPGVPPPPGFAAGELPGLPPSPTPPRPPLPPAFPPGGANPACWSLGRWAQLQLWDGPLWLLPAARNASASPFAASLITGA
jgi:hypothetical protein